MTENLQYIPNLKISHQSIMASECLADLILSNTIPPLRNIDKHND